MKLGDMIAAKLATGEADLCRVHFEESISGTTYLSVAMRDAAKTLALVGLRIMKSGDGNIRVRKGAYAEVWSTAHSQTGDILIGDAVTIAGTKQTTTGDLGGLRFLDSYFVDMWGAPLVCNPLLDSLQIEVDGDTSGTIYISADLVVF